MQPSILNRTVFCRDNIEVLRGMDSASVDLVYLDPPFNKKRNFHAPIGSSAEGASFKDIWYEEDTKEEWIGLIADRHPILHDYLQGIEKIGNVSNKYYLVYMAIRLLELQRIVKDTGSIYLHCDETMGHYLKLLMDCIFGDDYFRNEIIWH
ncbi:MAG: DNA methyltransferase, partial [Alphaproteobacteria bacterium]|nr:DNA methyltransferase [Alphaproteobacteria bacterium]